MLLKFFEFPTNDERNDLFPPLPTLFSNVQARLVHHRTIDLKRPALIMTRRRYKQTHISIFNQQSKLSDTQCTVSRENQINTINEKHSLEHTTHINPPGLSLCGWSSSTRESYSTSRG